MPKSKRVRTISLTQTKKHSRERKEQLVAKIRENVENFKCVVAFQTRNIRNTFLQDVRKKWNTSRFFFGRNKLMQVALGRTPEEEPMTGLHQVSRHLIGSCGLCLTNATKEEVLRFFSEYREEDYARSGFEATETVELPVGELPSQFTHSMEPYLRTTLLMPTEIRKGAVCLVRPMTVCEKGQKLTPEAARILKLLDKKMSTFFFNVTCIATKKKDSFEVEEIAEPPASTKNGKGDEEEEKSKPKEEEEESDEEMN